MFPAAAAETEELDGGGPRVWPQPWPQKTQELTNPPSGLPDSVNGTPFTLLSRPKALDFSMCIFLYHLGLGFEQCDSITYSENYKLFLKITNKAKNACARMHTESYHLP